MTAAASIQTELKVTPLTDLPNAELIERAVLRGEGVLDKNGALVVETVALQMTDLSSKNLRQRRILIGAR